MKRSHLGLFFLAAGCAQPPAESDAIAEQAPAPADYTQAIRESEVSFDMVWIPDGGFWIGKHEVTWDEFLLYCDFEEGTTVPPGADAVSKPSKPLDWTPYDRDWGVGRRPAVGMSWNSAQKYCQWLSQNTGVTYRLPTEAEWELACGDAPTDLSQAAWFDENSDDMTQEVGGKAPNANGLHDMLGNLWEYQRDPFSEDDAEQAVLRGGSWRDAASDLTPSNRLAFDPDWTLDDPNYPPGVWWIPDGDHLGFRIVREGPAPATK